ncbi:Serine/threonine-protein kinase domain protein [Ophiocordyceps camponoti-floridani]|uniref:Serine/threonine-protein kinase domain protein n=1 Tax=Ophiocordyceps camponoti-floridani TaxID=2030778 RepID=A0A8H4QBD5_9HYPO|nr:Serine/threonine-protein kinase domain protein [Ophiocordyceps camponoti-floridani]
MSEFREAVLPRCRLSGQPFVYEVSRGDRAFDSGNKAIYNLAPMWLNVSEGLSARYAHGGGDLQWKSVPKQPADKKTVYIVSMAEPEFVLAGGLAPIVENHSGCLSEFRLAIPGTSRSWIVGFESLKVAVEAFLNLQQSRCRAAFFYVYAVRSSPEMFPVMERHGLPAYADAVVSHGLDWLGPSNSHLIKYSKLFMNTLLSASSSSILNELLLETKWTRQNAKDQDLEEALGPKQDCNAADADQLVATHLNRFFNMIEQRDYRRMAGPREIARRLNLPVSELTDPDRLDNTACAISLNEGPVDYHPSSGSRGIVLKGDCCRLRDRLEEILKQHETLNRPSRGATPHINHRTEARTKSCTYFKQLSLGFQLHNDTRNDGTRDSIHLSIGSDNGEREVWVAKAPKPGFHIWTELDLEGLFGKKQIARSDISHISIVSKWPIDYTPDDAADDWNLQGLKLRGHCSDSSLVLTMDKFASVNQWLGRPSGTPSALVWGGDMMMSDWKVTGCSEFSNLKVYFSISYRPGSDTEDDIFIHFGNASRNADVLLLHSPGLNAQSERMIDMQTTFNRQTVPVADVRSFEVYSKAPASGNSHQKSAAGGWRSGAASKVSLLQLCHEMNMRKCFTIPGHPDQCQELYSDIEEGQSPKSGRVETGGFCMIYSDDKCLGDSEVLDESGFTFAFPFQPRSYRC